ncbi:SusD/RagB family nutrient-binding outer membrane lipoprotein [Paraflavisolibacter sp. H34]|uniref:SusD/RagB family nutrient-binding outer membrane lipoprotein n=1 Tax=Huijunlia imazamoxiresistens TaxID=3127457 RepID=UPI00301954DD
MKRMNRLTLLSFVLLSLAGCDKDFEQINTNPAAVINVDPGYLFSNAQRLTEPGSWEGESTIAQQFVNAYNLGTTAGFQFNLNADIHNRNRFNNTYSGPIKHLEHIISLVKDDASRSNLYQQARIWRACNYMTLVDAYGDVPYSEAGKAYLAGVYYPKYDKDEEIYADLYKELKEATAALDAAKDGNKFDLFYNGNVDAWKRLGYSLLLRLGMRYSKSDPNKARSIAQEAFRGGVMQSNSDDAVVKYLTPANQPVAGFENPLNTPIRNNNPYYYYLTEPLVNLLKSTSDPRLKYISAKYGDQTIAPSNASPDTTTANQYGFPIGYSDATLSSYPGYRPPVGKGQNYSQVNFNVVGNATAPVFYITHAQTQLLLAEAAFRGWLTGLAGARTAQEYYEAGVRASMDQYALYPNVQSPAIPSGLQNGYLAHPAVAYNQADALRQINTQYWIASLGNGLEAWANFRRSGFPALAPNNFNSNLQGGFVRRMAYPVSESAVNTEHYKTAVASMGGKDDLVTRVFWDTP